MGRRKAFDTVPKSESGWGRSECALTCSVAGRGTAQDTDCHPCRGVLSDSLKVRVVPMASWQVCLPLTGWWAQPSAAQLGSGHAPLRWQIP